MIFNFFAYYSFKKKCVQIFPPFLADNIIVFTITQTSYAKMSGVSFTEKF